jgi:hypothetical protein
MPLFHADVRVTFDAPDPTLAQDRLNKLTSDINVAGHSYLVAKSHPTHALLLKAGAAPPPGSTPTSAPKAPPSKPRGGFHYPSVRKRDDLGGLMGSD